MFSEVADGVFSVDSRFVEGKNGIILGRRGALTVDVGLYPDEGQAMADFVRSKGWQPDRVVLTHGHHDHVLGGVAYQGAEVFAHIKTPDVIRENLPAWAGRMKEPAEQLAARVLWPTVTFSHELTIGLGDKHCRVFPTPGHSPDSVSVLVSEGQVLFTGDAAVTGIVPAVQFYDAGLTEASQRMLATLDAEVMVTGHGPVIRGRAQVRDWLLWQADYLARVRERVRRELRRGLDPDLVLKMVSYDEFVGKRLPADRHNMTGRHVNTVNKIIQEELAGRQ